MKTSIVLSAIFLLFSFGCNNQKNSTSQNQPNPSRENGISATPNDYMGAYTIHDKERGTKTVVTLEGNKRLMVTNALPNHKTGSFPNAHNPNTISAQNIKYEFPLTPKYTGDRKWVREPGVALNGVKFEPETAEMLLCESGERYRIEAFQNMVDLGLDFNNAHVQPTGAYHYHGVSASLVEAFDKGEDLVHIGFAHDGFPIYYSKSNAYKPSYSKVTKARTGTDCNYQSPEAEIHKDMKGTLPDGTFVSDWEFVAGVGNLDACNGITIDGKYIYLITTTYPYVGRCLNGEYTEPKRKGPPPPPRPGGGGQDHPHPHPH